MEWCDSHTQENEGDMIDFDAQEWEKWDAMKRFDAHFETMHILLVRWELCDVGLRNNRLTIRDDEASASASVALGITANVGAALMVWCHEPSPFLGLMVLIAVRNHAVGTQHHHF